MAIEIKEARKTRIPEEYQVFAIDEFLNSKTLKIENVKTDKVRGVDCIKVDARIIEDRDGYNKDKVIIIRIDKLDDETFESQLNELRLSFGKVIHLDPEEDVEDIFVYRANILTIIAMEFTIHEDSKQYKLERPTKSDRPLAKMSKYHEFNIEDFLEDNTLELHGMYNDKGKNHAFFDAFIDRDNIVRICVLVEDFEELPAELLRLNTDFYSAIESYVFSSVSSSHYGTRWTLYFDNLTFKPGVVAEEAYTLGVNEETEYESSTESDFQ